MIERSYIYIFAFFISLGPIFWLPNVPPALFFYLKNTLLIVLFFYSICFFINEKKMSFPGGISVFLPLLFMLKILFIYYIFGDNRKTLIDIINLFQILIFLISSNVIINKNKIFLVLKIATNIILFFVLFSLICFLYVPYETNPLNNDLMLIQTGFGGSRTGWSPSIGLFIPLVYLFYNNIIFMYIIMSSQIITGGRAGFFTAILILPLLLYFKNTKILLYSFIFSLLILSYVAYYYINFEILDSRILDFVLNFDTSNVDSLSTGRLSLFLNSINSLSNSPLIGYGYLKSFVGEDVHNVFVKNWLYYGFFYFLLSVYLVLLPFIFLIKNIYFNKNVSHKIFFKILILVLAYGLIIGLLEPSIIFGNFNTFNVWWFCYAILVSKKYDYKIINNKVMV